MTIRGLAEQRRRNRVEPPHKGHICCAALCLVFFAPLMIFIYLFLRIAGEPAFTAQPYVRDDGSAQQVWQFQIAGLLTAPPGKNLDTGGRWLCCKVGRFLFLSRLELLPMLYNVCRGEITLPEMLGEVVS